MHAATSIQRALTVPLPQWSQGFSLTFTVILNTLGLAIWPWLLRWTCLPHMSYSLRSRASSEHPFCILCSAPHHASFMLVVQSTCVGSMDRHCEADLLSVVLGFTESVQCLLSPQLNLVKKNKDLLCIPLGLRGGSCSWCFQNTEISKQCYLEDYVV